MFSLEMLAICLTQRCKKLDMKKILLLLTLTSLLLVAPKIAYADPAPACSDSGDVGNIRPDDGATCVCTGGFCYFDESITNSGHRGSNVMGNVLPPADILALSPTTARGGNGLIPFVSTLIRLFTIIAGIYVMFNFILAGAQLVFSAGNANAHADIRDKLLFSTIGLLIIIGMYTIIGLVGLMFFGDAGYILNPTIMGALDLQP